MKCFVSPEETRAALAALPAGATTEDFVAALQGAASAAVVDAEITEEHARADVLDGLRQRIEELRVGLEADRRERAKPEVDRYLAMLRRRR